MVEIFFMNCSRHSATFSASLERSSLISGDEGDGVRDVAALAFGGAGCSAEGEGHPGGEDGRCCCSRVLLRSAEERDPHLDEERRDEGPRRGACAGHGGQGR